MKAAPTFALVVLPILFGSCAPSHQFGDARVARSVPVFPWDFGKIPGYSLSLPAVPLSRRGTMEFIVSALPTKHQPANYDYYLELTGGSLYRDGRSQVRASHWSARIAVDVFASDGATLFHDAVRLGDLIWYSDHSVIRNSTFLSNFTNRSQWDSATTYKVRISVLEPSKASTEMLRITGFGRD